MWAGPGERSAVRAVPVLLCLDGSPLLGVESLACLEAWASQVALVVKNSPATAGNIRDVGSIPELGRSPGERHGNPLWYSCLENPMDKGLHGIIKDYTVGYSPRGCKDSDVT